MEQVLTLTPTLSVSVSGLGSTSESLEHNYQEMVIHNVTYSVLMKLWLVELLIRI